ncbi:hypothetical protein QYE76_009183 [Lolium multiflorum]|uniref:PWWP domain-containing protein n=1 Tax=Lolium multiflorum TaxID=4521 RepID=A0AAD8TSR0_LOLMU|nr:hypothetical protein QYE76_009183 [Lolium multiflorum]
MASSLAPEEGEPASPCAAAGSGRTVASPVRHMHRDVSDLLLATGTSSRRRQPKRSVPASAAAERARYDGAFQEDPPTEEERRFAPPRLVWVKVLGHPWWPGQVFHPSDASALALREKKRRDAVLVACFGDRSFVWADAVDLLPFRDGFPRLAERAGKFALACAVSDALDEVARRVDTGLSCGCGVVKKQVFVNDGLRRGARGADAVDAAFARDAFCEGAFVRYVRALALAPQAGADGLDLAVAAAQLRAFARWRSAANPEVDVAHGAMVVAVRAGRGRATTPRKARAKRGLFRGDAPAGGTTLSMCARAAAADKAFMQAMFPGEAREEHASAMAVTSPDGAGAELRDLAVANTPQQEAFGQWRGAPILAPTMDMATGGALEACRGTAKEPRSTGVHDADADPGAFTSCISSGEDAASKNEDDDGWETESEDFEVSSDSRSWGGRIT